MGYNIRSTKVDDGKGLESGMAFEEKASDGSDGKRATDGREACEY